MFPPRRAIVLSTMIYAVPPTACTDFTPPNAGDFEPGAPGTRDSLLARPGQNPHPPAPSGRFA